MARSLTVLFAVPRRSFVVLVADGGTTVTTPDGATIGVDGSYKFYVAKDRALAVAASGFASTEGRPVLESIRDVVEAMPRTASSAEIGIAILDRVGPATSAHRVAVLAAGGLPPDCAYIVAQVTDDREDLVFAELDGPPGNERPVTRTTNRGGRLYLPNCLKDYANSSLATDEQRGADISDGFKLRDRALEIVAGCVKHERAVHGGSNVHCGFPVSVAVVDGSGVRVQSIVPESGTDSGPEAAA